MEPGQSGFEEMKISRIPLCKPSCILIICLLYQIGCASTRTVTVSRSDYDDIEYDQVVFVYLKTGDFFALKNVGVEGDYLTGVMQSSNIPIKLQFSDVNYVTTEKKTITALGVIEALLIATAVAALIVLITCAIASEQ